MSSSNVKLHENKHSSSLIISCIRTKVVCSILCSQGMGSSLLLWEDVQCSWVEACFFQDLRGCRQRVKAHDNASAKIYICRFIELKQIKQVISWFVGHTRAQLRISKLLSKSRLTRRLPSTGFSKDVPRSVYNAEFIWTHTQRTVVLCPLSCAPVPMTCIPCYKTIHSIIILGDGWTVWDAVT
jgi:hypothetical protein